MSKEEYCELQERQELLIENLTNNDEKLIKRLHEFHRITNLMSSYIPKESVDKLKDMGYKVKREVI